MKRRKILVLIPVLGLFLSGCTFQEGFGMVKNWIGDNVYEPAKQWIENITGKGGEKEEPTPEPQPQPQPQPQPEQINYGTQTAPLSMSEFRTNLDKAVDYSTIEEGATKTHAEAPFYVKGKVVSNEAASNGKIRFTNLVGTNDRTAEVTGYYLVFDSSLDSTALGAKDAMFAKEVVIKGYGILYNKAGSKVYEIGEQSEEGEKGTILSVADPTPTAGVNYGSKEAPLTASQACALLDSEMPSNAKMYVGGKVKSNTAWSTQYNNCDIVITDGEKDFTIYRTATFPEGVTKESITANSLKDFNVVASGIGKIYQSTYELNQGCVVEKVEDTTPKPASVTVTNATQMVAGGQLTLTATVGPEGAPQDVTWSIVSGEQTTAEGASIANGVLSAPNAGTVLVKATAVGTEVSGTALITVTAPSQTLVTGIVATPSSIEMLDNAEPVEISIEVSPTGYQEEVTWTVSEGYDVISLANHKVSPLKAGSAKVRIEGATSHVGVTVNVTVNSSAPEKGTAENPYTASEAATYAASLNLASGKFDDHEIYVTGLVVSASGSNDFRHYDLKDTKESTTAFKIYGTKESPIAYVNDTATFKGTIKNYSGTLELTGENNNVDWPAIVGDITRGTSSITVNGSHVTTTAPDHGTNNSDVSFTVTPETGYEVVSVSVANTPIEAVAGTYTITVKGDTLIVIVTQEEGGPEQTTVTKTSAALQVEKGWTACSGSAPDDAIFDSFDLDSNITVSFVGTGSTASYWTSGTSIRIYGDKNTSTTSVTIAGKTANISIKSITLTFTLSGSPTFPLTSGTPVDVNAQSATYNLTCGSNNGQLRISAFSVTYIINS